MKDNFISEMNTFFFNESPRCHLYRNIFDNNVLQFYLERPVNYILISHIFVKWYISHNLNIETGRFYNLDRHERMCSMCSLNVVEDEYHFILQCEKYIDVRRKHLKKYYWQRPSCFKLVQLLSVHNIKELNNLGKYLY
jgi:hypothetical protein